MLVYFHHKWYFQRFPPPRGFDPYFSVICRRLLACNPQACKVYLCPPKAQERARRQQQRHQRFHGWGILHVESKVLEQHPTTPPSAVDGGQDTAAVFTPGKWLRGRASYLGTDVSLAHQLLSLIRTIAGWGLGQVCWKVSLVNRV